MTHSRVSRRWGAIPLLFALALTSCSTPPPPRERTVEATEEATPTEQRDARPEQADADQISGEPLPTETPQERKNATPRREVRSYNTAELQNFLIHATLPSGSGPRFLGFSPRLADREQEFGLAVLHAAEQYARYKYIAARYRYVSQRSSGQIGYVDDIITDWDAEGAPSLAAGFTVLESFQSEDGTVVLCEAVDDESGYAPPPVSVQRNEKGEPNWIVSQPRIPGYVVGVGVIQRSRRLVDSINLADEAALKELLLQSGATLRMVQESRSVERAGTTERLTTSEEVTAAFGGFSVISRFISRDGRYLYSLAVAREFDSDSR